MKHIFTLSLALILLTFSAPAKASVDDGTPVSPELMAPLVAWVSHATNTQINSMPIATASGRVLKTALGLEGAQQARSIAAYLPGQIIINNIIWDPESVTSQSYIVHELVHHAQLLSGRTYACHNDKEREAYTLQNQWLKEHGEDPIVSQEWIERMASCGTNGQKVAMN